MKNEFEKVIRIKIAISLRRLLEKSKKVYNTNDDFAQSYNQIAIITDLRKGTVSDTFNAKSIPSSSTMILIIEAMGFNMCDFANIYCSINRNEVNTFQDI